MSISCVSASDNSNATSDLSSDISVPGSFDELNTDIQNLNSGDVYNVTQDYVFSDNQYLQIRKQIINIGVDNVTINGNGHVIDGNFRTALFEVTGCNVKIFNLTFINSKDFGYHIPMHYDLSDYNYGNTGVSETICRYNDEVSPICWSGDNGLMSDCSFSNNTAINGGAITWTGSNGIINNCQFINNIAKGVGGAIYIGGENNTITNSTFTNSVSQLSGEAIYLDRARKNITLKNVEYDGLLLIDGQITNIDANDLFYSYCINIAPIENNAILEKYNRVDIIPLLYKSFTLGGVNFINDNVTSYFCSYNDTSKDFKFSICMSYEKIMDCYAGIEYIQQFSFKNITEFSQTLKDARYKNYTHSIIQIGTVYVNNTEDYSKLLSKKIIPNYFKRVKNETRELNIIFTDQLSINSNACLDSESWGIDLINIDGNGSKIQATSDDRDENTWINNNKNIIISNIQIEGFNTAIMNKAGTLILNNVIFNNNRMDYITDPDWGAAILNTGYCICNNCTFTNNYCSKGGAIFNTGILIINNCTFKGNTGYSEGDNVLNVDKGIVYLDGDKIVGNKGPITYTESATKTSDTVFLVAAIFAAVASAILFAVPAIPGILLSIGVTLAMWGGAVAILGSTITCIVIFDTPNYERIHPAIDLNKTQVINEINFA